MNEFISNFNSFRDWLYEAEECSEHNSAKEEILKLVINKFEEFNLNKASLICV